MLLVSLLTSGARADTGDVTVLAHRTAGATELYIAARADVLFDLMGVTPKMFVGEGGVVDFGTLRYGTFEAGDALLARTQVEIAGQDAGLEAMSLMAHPFADQMPMRTPMEALIAIGVCNGPPAGTLIAVSDLQAYVGYLTETDSHGGPISIKFEGKRAGSYTITLHEYDAQGHISTDQQSLNAQGVLKLSGERADPHVPFGLLVLGLLAGLGAVVPVLAALKTRPRSLIGVT